MPRILYRWERSSIPCYTCGSNCTELLSADKGTSKNDPVAMVCHDCRGVKFFMSELPAGANDQIQSKKNALRRYAGEGKDQQDDLHKQVE